MPLNTTIKSGYKQTKVGVIPEEWDVVELEKTARVVDSLHQTPCFEADGYPMVRVTDIKTGNLSFTGTLMVSETAFAEFTKNYRPRRDDIVLSRVGSYGISSFVETDEPFCMGQNTVVLHPKLPPRFLYYVLNSRGTRLQIEDGSYGSGYKSLSLKNIKELYIPVPPTDAEQRAIATALGDVDALIAALDKLIAKKRDLKTGTMQQLLTGQIRLPGFSGEWAVKRFGEIGSFSKGRGLAKDDMTNSGDLPALPYTAIYTDHDEIIQIARIRHFTARTHDLEVINSPHLLIAGSSNMLENIGKATAFLGGTNLAVGGDILIYRTTADVRFLSFLMSTTPHRRKVVFLSQGSTIRHVYASTFQKYEILLPSLKEQIAIATVLSDMEAEIAALEARRDKTCALKQGMMQKLLTGQVRLT